ncbi:chorismate mutase [Indioceanicola profundi]|uniref:chorismate mutase n=1 Tax=Indioceanicola profundi TaxID=2220096 RepID=UPI000E6ADD18|nr:chorismate mutase [Indioceanicola profundi]
MPPSPEKLDDLRSEIDKIDDALHDLLMRRTEIVLEIGAAKQPGRPYFRPGREAEILRRLAARHEGAFPVGALMRMWREMMAALTRVQGAFAVAVCAPEDQRSIYWDIARDHYGSTTPMIAANTPMAAMRCVSDGTAAIAVVPWPVEEEADPWWRYLFSTDPKTPRIIARLPFVARGWEDGDALALAAVPMEQTGDDRTLLGIELSVDVSRGRLKESLEGCGLVTLQFRTHHLGGGAGAVHLVEVEDYVPADDSRLNLLAERLGEGLVRVLPVGAYARQLVPPDLRRG